MKEFNPRQRGVLATIAIYLMLVGLAANGSRLFSVKNQQVQCCLCLAGHSQDFVFTPFTNKCLTNPPPYRDCKKVQVQGNGCSFFRVEEAESKPRCFPATVTYVELGVEKILPPPPGLISPCSEVPTLSPIDEKKIFSTQAEGANNGESDCFTSCGRDPTNNTNCVATITADGKTTVLSSLPIPQEFTTCSLKACSLLFPKAYFGDTIERCSRFIHGPS